MDKAAYIAQLERMLAGQRQQREDLQQQLDTLRQEKEQLDSKKKRLESQYETVAGRLASVTTGEANPVHQVRIIKNDRSAMRACDGMHRAGTVLTGFVACWSGHQVRSWMTAQQ